MFILIVPPTTVYFLENIISLPFKKIQLNKIEPSILGQIFEGIELHDLNQELIYSSKCQLITERRIFNPSVLRIWTQILTKSWSALSLFFKSLEILQWLKIEIRHILKGKGTSMTVPNAYTAPPHIHAYIEYVFSFSVYLISKQFLIIWQPLHLSIREAKINKTGVFLGLKEFTNLWKHTHTHVVQKSSSVSWE